MRKQKVQQEVIRRISAAGAGMLGCTIVGDATVRIIET
jgi:hypothetical protein